MMRMDMESVKEIVCMPQGVWLRRKLIAGTMTRLVPKLKAKVSIALSSF